VRGVAPLLLGVPAASDLAAYTGRMELPATASCADASVQLGVPLRVGPPGLLPIDPAWRAFGPARPVLHVGSVDAFLEACQELRPGDVLVVDDRGRTDRACIGDLTALEVKGAGGGGMVVWGCHRDSVQLLEVGLPVFSLGARPNGPLGVEPAEPGTVPALGEHRVEAGDVVVADADGVLLLPGDRAEEILGVADEIARTELGQAEAMRIGRSLREQVEFEDYLERRRQDPSYTFRDHLRRRGGAIER
jgi:4-hydroxy-4-methyl-2-oxoglutarate aldolase